jgi:hypothetical protein
VSAGSTLPRVRGPSVGESPPLRLEALEVRFAISCTGSGADELARAVEDAWEWCLVDNGVGNVTETDHALTVLLESDPDVLAERAGESQLFGTDLPTVMDRLSPLVTRLAVTTRREDLLMVHACAVGDPETGHAVVLFGPSGTGKTTLARTLCTDLAYLSDETAAITEDLRIVPYPKPLSIIATPGDPLKEQVSAGRIGLRPAGSTTYRLRALVQLRRQPDHEGDAVLEPLAVIDALPELVSQTSYTREMERPLHRLADLAGRVGGVRRVTYAESAQLRPVVRALLDGTA